MVMLADQCQTVAQPKYGAKTADINPTKPRTENAQPQGHVVMIHKIKKLTNPISAN